MPAEPEERPDKQPDPQPDPRPEPEPARQQPPPAQPRPTLAKRAMRVLPWVLGLLIIYVLVRRLPVTGFRAALSSGPHLTMIGFVLLQLLVGLGFDSFATWVLLLVGKVRRPMRDVVAVRAATYLLSIVHYGLGQGGIGFYLNRTGTGVGYSTGMVLMLIGINLATMALTAGAAILMTGVGSTTAAIEWTVAATCGGFVLYLGVIALRPGFLARVPVLAPLFAAGVGGHLTAVGARFVHVLWFVLAQWLTMRIWHIHVPFVDGMRLLPVYALLSTLPITPAGLGTAQAALVYLFRDFAPGATADARGAYVLGYSIVIYVYGMITLLGIGVAALPAARRAQAPA